MNPLLKTIIKSGLALVAGFFIAKTVGSKIPIKDKTGQPIPLTGGLTTKSMLILAAVTGVGGAILYFIGKFLKVPFLKS